MVNVRICGNKVRTGCLTCKTRHLKCGEEKPACNRCITSGRVCDGYSTSRPVFKPATKRLEKGLVMIHYTANLPTCQIRNANIPTALNTAISHDTRDQRFFEYFRTRTALDLVSCFGSELWSLYVLQLARNEPAVRHVVIGIACLYEQFESAATDHFPDSRFALRQYITAIQHVIGSFNRGSQQSTAVALLLCALFASFESLQGHCGSALTHVTSGLKVLQEQQVHSKSLSSSYIPARLLKGLFSRLGSQLLEIANTSTTPVRLVEENCLQEIAVPQKFSSIEEAEETLNNFLHWIHHPMSHVECSTVEGPVPLTGVQRQELLATQVILAKPFGRWSAALDEYLVQKLRTKLSCGGSPTISMEPGIYILQIWREVIKVWQCLDLSAGETAWDPFIDQFKSVADLATSFVDQSARLTAHYSPPSPQQTAPRPPTMLGASSSTSALTDFSSLPGPIRSTESNAPNAPVPAPIIKPTFSLSIGIIPPLYIVASRCRHPAIRRQVIHLLSICNRREGIWDSRLSSQVAKYILDIEEAGARQYLKEVADKNANEFCEPIEINSMEQIPECVRVTSLWTSCGPERQGTVRYKKGNAGNRRLGSQEKVYEGHFYW